MCQGIVKYEIVTNTFYLFSPEFARHNVAHGVIVSDKFVSRVERVVIPFLMARKLREHIECFAEQGVCWQFLEVASIACYCRVLVHHVFVPVLHNIVPLLYGLAFLMRETENTFGLVAVLRMGGEGAHREEGEEQDSPKDRRRTAEGS